MTTYNTGNPLGSNDPKDLFDNARNLDDAVNNPVPGKWFDRLGSERKNMAAVEQSAPIAVAAADRAESAAAAASLGIGTYYPNIAAGRAAVANGQSFWVEPNSTDSLSRFTLFTRTSDSTQDQKFQAVVASDVDGQFQRLADGEHVNRFTEAELAFRDKSRITTNASALTIQPSTHNGTPCWALTIPGNGGVRDIRFRFPPGDFPSGYVSAGVRILSVDASPGSAANGIRLGVIQSNSAGNTIGFSFTLIAGAQSVTDTVYGLPSVQVQELTRGVEWMLEGRSGAGQPDRIIKFREMLIADGNNTRFILPNETGSKLSLFPDSGYAGYGSTIFQASAQYLDGRLAMVMQPGTSISQVAYRMQALRNFSPGKIIDVRAEAISDTADGADISIIFYRANGVEITPRPGLETPTVAQVWEPLHLRVGIPEETAYIDIRFLKRASASFGAFANVLLTSSDLGSKLFAIHQSRWADVHCSPTGDDNNPGTYQSPVRSISRAMLLGGGFPRVFVRDGDYNEAPQLTTGTRMLEVRAHRNAVVRLIGGVQITGATKTPGYSKVWQLSVATSPRGRWLIEHDVPESGTLISPELRSPYHAGRTHMLPFTRIWAVSSIAAIDAAERPSWFWDSGVLYFSVAGGGDPADTHVRYISGETAGITSPFYGANGAQTLSLSGIESYYWLHGFRAWDYSRVEFESCSAFGNASNGMEYSDSQVVCVEGAYLYGNGQDGHGGQLYRGNPRNTQLTAHLRDIASGHNWDDGGSLHQWWRGFESRGLYEFNGDRGIATAIGAHTSHSNTISRYNGQILPHDDGVGFSCVGTTPADGGIGTQMDLHQCVSIGNMTNFLAAGSPNNILSAYGCVSDSPVSTHYSATSGGRLLARDSRYVGPGAAVATSGGGIVTTRNSELLEI